MIVVVRSARRLVGELFLRSSNPFFSTCSACTVKRIRHGLVQAAFAGDLVAGLLLLRAGGVEMKKSWTRALPDVLTSGFLGVMIGPSDFVGLVFTGEGVGIFSFDKANGSGEESSNLSSRAILLG